MAFKARYPSAGLFTACSVSMVSPTTTLSIFQKQRIAQVAMFRVAAYRSNSIALTDFPNADPQYVYNENSIYLPSFDDLKSTRTDLNNKELQNMMIRTL